MTLLGIFLGATCCQTHNGLYKACGSEWNERAWDGGGVLEVSIFLGKLGFTLSITPVNVHWTKPSLAYASNVLPCIFRSLHILCTPQYIFISLAPYFI